MGPCAQAGPGGAGGQEGKQWLGARQQGDDLSGQWGDHSDQQIPCWCVWQEGEGRLGKGEDLGRGAPRSISGPGACLGMCPSLGSIPTQGPGEQDGAGSLQKGQLLRAACQEAMQEPCIPHSLCAGTPITAWLRRLPLCHAACLPRLSPGHLGADGRCQGGKATGEGEPWVWSCFPGWLHMFSPCPGLVCSPGAPLICQGLMPGEGKTNLPRQLPAPLAASWGGSGHGSGDCGRLASCWPPAPWLVLPASASCSRRLCGAALQLGQVGHVADLEWEDKWGAIFSLWQKPTHRHWVRALLGYKKSHWGGPCSTTGLSGPEVGTVPCGGGAHMMWGMCCTG